MTAWMEPLRLALERRSQRSLLRTLEPMDAQGRFVIRRGQRLLNLASNDYLALSDHPRLKAAAIRAVEQHGTGSGASRLICGTRTLHAQVEARFAAFKHAEAAVMFPTGTMANWGLLQSLAGPGDTILMDKLTHASLLDAARATGAQVRIYPHLHHGKLERLLSRWTQTSDATGDPGRPPRCLMVTDSVFSMDGDVADLPRLCELAEGFGAILIVDEAHATGVLGGGGSGLCEAMGVQGRVPLVVSTVSKALGGLGGVVTGPQVVIDTLVNEARSLIYTTAVPVAQAAVLDAALDVVREEPQRREQVLAHARTLRGALAAMGWSLPDSQVPTPIVPLLSGSSEAALALAQYLLSHNILAVAIRPPTVAPGMARVRLGLRCDLQERELQQLCDVLDRYDGPRLA